MFILLRYLAADVQVTATLPLSINPAPQVPPTGSGFRYRLIANVIQLTVDTGGGRKGEGGREREREIDRQRERERERSNH